MSYYNNRNQEPLPKEDTETWECTAEECNGWMRKNFTSSECPLCPLCNQEMKSGNRFLTSIANNTSNLQRIFNRK
ncbi:hypothetical protein HOO54_17745 [Bacillus sp. WMMC1349]|uniref:cold-shock protein n=1 Tax=Bacillus sp. WMMC1349 TaxID=2736254 RepID=UPI0015547856|nr:cold-shock protein [Bacillus sp. WMMC1349]NPC94011.1 hypothetical protein [Bacillus sp. WMMC1349]